MTLIQRLLAGSALLALALFSAEKFGEHKVQAKWDIDKAERAAVAKADADRNEKNLAALDDKFKKEIEHAKSEASRRAVANWLKSHGLLPDGTPVRGAGCEAEVPQGADGASSELGAVERLADNCIRDARKVELCTEWAVREGLETD
jgi:membrane protein involved in colicin uptake